MYSPKLIQAKLNVIQSQIDKRPKDLQFNLKEYSVAEANFYTTHLCELLNPEYFQSMKGKPLEPKGEMFIRPLFQDESNFIENERILCQNNFLYWATRYAWITSVGITSELTKSQLFRPWVAQKMFLSVVAMMEEQFIAILIQVLKARQLGSSTLAMLILCHKVTYQTYVKVLIGSSDPDKTSEMAYMMAYVWANLPPWLRPLMTMSQSAKEEMWVNIPSLNNKVIRQHGTQLSGLGRGNTPTAFALSEVPDFANPDEDIDASLLPAVHENPNCFGVLESTAKGDQGYWPKTWRYNVQNWSKGEADMFPLFFPWNVGTDIYPTKTWERKHPIPKDWKPSKESISCKQRCEEYARHDPLLRQFLGEGYTLPVRQQYFYELQRKQAQIKGNLAKFIEEHPATPDEAFQVSGRSIFTLEMIEEMKSRARPLALYYGKPAIFSLIGTDIATEYEPDIRDVDTDRPPIEITSDLMYGQNKAIYKLVPINYESSIMSVWGKAFDMKIFIWEFPFQSGLGPRLTIQEYGLGVDCSEGIGKNKTAIEIVRKGSMLEYSEQVCEFASKHISANELVPWVDALGQFYSKYNNDVTNECKLVIEMACGGNGLQHRMRVDRGWSNFHRWEGAMDSPKRKNMSIAKLGWETNRWTRPWIVGDVARDIKDGYLLLHSPFLIRECQTLQKEDDASKIEAKGDDTDDLFFAVGMPHFSLSIWDIRKRLEIKYAANPLYAQSELSEALKARDARQEPARTHDYIMDRTLPTLD